MTLYVTRQSFCWQYYFLYAGNKIAIKGLSIFNQDNNNQTVEAKITKIIKTTESDAPEWSSVSFDNKEITFKAEIKKGLKKEYITAVQSISSYDLNPAKEVEESDKVFLSLFPEDRR